MTAAAQARHTSLVRLERAAGQAFGYEDHEPASSSRGSLMLAHSGFALATMATALAATITYFV